MLQVTKPLELLYAFKAMATEISNHSGDTQSAVNNVSNCISWKALGLSSFLKNGVFKDIQICIFA